VAAVLKWIEAQRMQTRRSDDCCVVLVQCKVSETLYTRESMPPFVTLAKERPGLMAFYERLKAKAYPDGPSENWDEVMWDPSKYL
jgi:hypothetical protein